MNITHILFDADDTLFNFQSAAKKSLLSTLGSYNISGGDSEYDRFRKVNKKLWAQLERKEITEQELKDTRFPLYFEDRGMSCPAGFSDLFIETLAVNGSEPMPDAESVLSALFGKYTLAVVTNGFSYVQHKRFDRASLSKYISRIFISGDLGIRKPDLRFFDWVLGGLGCPDREKVLIVGDSLSSDIQGGINAGIHTCWYNREGAKDPVPQPEFEIKCLPEILSIL